MKKNQKGFGVVEAVIIIFVIIVLLGVLGWVSDKNDKKKASSNTAKTTASQSRGTAKPTPYKDANWAGYLKYGTSGTGKDMTAVSGEWIVPDITPAEDFELSSAWIGIGGYGNYKKDLVQIGTDQGTGPNLSTGKLFYALWECWPQLSTRIPDVQVKPGDNIQSSIAKVGADWTLSLTNKTNGQRFNKTVSCSPDQSTAEWILENPAPGGQDVSSAVMPKITPITFSNMTVNNKPPGITDMMQLTLVHGDNQTIMATPSDLTGNGTGFTVRGVR